MDQEKVWDEIAGKWGVFRTHMHKEVRDFLNGCEGKLLDIGCGSGRNFLKKEGLEIYGLDFSEKMLDLAKINLDKMKTEAVLKKAHSWELPYPDDFFDHVLLYSVIHCIKGEEKRAKTIEETYRVLKRGGTAFISCWSGKGPRISAKRYRQTAENLVPWTVDGVKYERYTYIFKEGELKNIIENTGFDIVRSWEDKHINFIVQKPTLS